MEEILHQLIGSLSHCLQGIVHPRWCRISSINSMESKGIYGESNRGIYEGIILWGFIRSAIGECGLKKKHVMLVGDDSILRSGNSHPFWYTLTHPVKGPWNKKNKLYFCYPKNPKTYRKWGHFEDPKHPCVIQVHSPFHWRVLGDSLGR